MPSASTDYRLEKRREQVLNEFRERTRHLAAQRTERDTFPVELARSLRRINQDRLYREWRYATFKKYVQVELGWARSRAYHLINLLNRFEALGFNSRQMDDLGTGASYSKLLHVLPIITRQNRDFVIYKVQTMKRAELRQFIHDAKSLMAPGAA